MPDQGLRLNALSRYTKQSPRLVLEEYGHCEVPAGCGGVVLRWRRPDEPIPMVMRFFSGNGRLEYQGLDGVDRRFASKILVTYGTHALTFIIQEIDLKYAIVLLAGKLDEQYDRILRPHGDTTLLSLPDGTWKYRLKPPEGDAWLQPDFDDQGWLPLVAKRFIGRSKIYGGRISEWTKDLTDQGAQGLGVDMQGPLIRRMRARLGKQAMLPAIYIRKTFTLLRHAEQE